MIVFIVYFSGFLVNGFVSGSLYKQSFFPRTSPGWQRVMVLVQVSYQVIALFTCHN